jgi:Carboxypeptidase regulatory-like domain/TonB dependent receptor
MRLGKSMMALTVALWASLAGASFGQSTNAGEINGLVADSTGAAVPDATVTVLNVGTGISKEFTTNQDGVYDTSSIVAGTYKITFSRQGFTTLVRSSVTINVGTTTVNATLTVGSVSASVIVTTDVPLLRTESGEQSTTLSAQTLQELPQVGQDWSSFNILLPGAAGAPMGAQGSLGTGTSNGTTLAVNGNLPFSTVLSDGAETTLPASANSDILTQETIQEVQVSTSAFSAQYGVGGILYNQISKGGGDRFHGAAYEYFQNDALNADGFGGNKSTLRYHNFGGSIGGPILKQRMFFYFNYDQIIQHGGNAPSFFATPTAAFLAGDFTGANTIYDPSSTTLVNGVVHRVSFADEYGNGNKIPANLIDPVAKAVQAYFPASNAAGGAVANGVIPNNYVFTSPSSNPFRKFFGRLDYQVTPTNRITISESEGDNPGATDSSGLCPIGCQTGDVSKNNAQATDVWVISPRITNELRLGYTNQLNFFIPATLGQGYPAKLGWQFAKGDNFPAIQINGFNQGCNGASILCVQTNAVYKEHAYDPSDVVTMVVGRHILHFGGELLIYQNNSTAWGNLNAGTLGYTGAYTASTQGDSSTGVAYADFLLGQTQNWSANETPEYGGRLKLPQLFVQDDYKVRPNLTLNLGLRYQIQTGWSDTKGNETSFDPTIENAATGTLGAMWYGTTQANGRSRIQKSVYDTFLPRVGFSYQLNQLTTIRGGFGLYAYNWSNDTYNGASAGPILGGAFGAKGTVTDTTNGVTPVVILSGTGANLPYIGASTDPAAYNGSNVQYAAYHQPVGGSYQWNIQAQRQINNNLVGSLAYVASHGHNLPFPVDINQVPEGRLSPNDQQFRPYPQYGTIGTAGAVPHENAISNYNSLQATIQERLSYGLSFNFSYVWSHFLDDIDSAGWGSHSGTTNYQNSYSPAANYGNSNFDVRNAFKGDFVYQLPFGTGMQFANNSALLDEIVGGWKLSSTIVVQSGQPFTPVISGQDNSFSLAGSNYAWYPNVIGSPKLQGRNIHEWFNEAAFAVPAPGTFGNEARNQLTGPALSTVNLSLGKSFAFGEQVRLQIRGDANNVFNHASFGLPTNGLTQCPSSGTLPATCSAYGAIQTDTSTINSYSVTRRTMQLSGRLTF